MVGGCGEALGDPLEAFVVDVLDLAAARVEALDDPLGDVEPGDLVTGLGEGDGERQPDVPQADDPDSHAGSV